MCDGEVPGITLGFVAIKKLGGGDEVPGPVLSGGFLECKGW